MSTILERPPTAIVYPESDGKPIADNTIQFRYIVTIQGGLDRYFSGAPDVFVAGDLFWYPVEGRPDIRVAPDVLVAFGRPKGDRRSYLQWQEDNIAPQVVFEILSPGNRAAEMISKFRFYERYGVEEYYVYDPDSGELSGWRREGQELVDIPVMRGWVSPRLGVRFELNGVELELYDPTGRRFATYLELAAEAERAQQEAERAQQEAERERELRLRTQEQMARLAERLRALGVEPDSIDG
jgi:Uma2 family endonuclease